MADAAATSRVQIETPEWVKDAVFYQIFPDRFAKSARVEKPTNLEPWGAEPTIEGYQGGDLLGVVEHLDHLVALGINAIYFTPIFQSASNHRYHTHDYLKVDPLLGGDEALRELVREAHARGIRIVLDGVFNHASRGFFQFNTLLEHGPHSPYLDWFLVQDWPLSPYDGTKPANYTSWWDNRALPKLNTENPQVREFIMDVAEYWIREFDIDGWRLDVPEEIATTGFWEEFRRRVKAVKADAYIVGEIWREARAFLQGDRFDAVMNYLFTSAIIAFAGGERVLPHQTEGRSYDPYPPIDAAAFSQRIQRVLNLYAWDVSLVQLNLLDSHDTSRLLTIVDGDKATMKLCTLFQMTYPGAPSIYYGDEIGLIGAKDPSLPHSDPEARRAFPWDDKSGWDTDLLATFKQLTALRHEHRVLRRGHFHAVYAEGAVFCHARQDASTTILVAMNVSEAEIKVDLPVGAYFADGTALRALYGSGGGTVQNGELCQTLAPRSGLVLAC